MTNSRRSKNNLLKMNSNRSTRKPMRRNLNSSKKIDEVTYYSLADVETVIEAVLSELSADPSVGITLNATDAGITLNCVNEAGEDYEVEVELEDETAEAEAAPAEAEVAEVVDEDLASSRRLPKKAGRSLASSRATKAPKKNWSRKR